MLQDPEVMYAWEHAFSDSEVQEWLDRQRERYRRYGFGLWAVVEKRSGRMIGQCGLTPQEYAGETVCEIGYLLERAFWGQGFAIEAAVACKRYAFGPMDREEVYSLIRDSNLPSQKVARRNGMTLCGEFIKRYRGQDMRHLAFRVRRGPEAEESAGGKGQR
ncbi:MAG: GNAT family N-acetyltransferase, partial [Clostridiales bacterium]|nr:GNAT family N-acetyltransferase [Clostridiales bacterium]